MQRNFANRVSNGTEVNFVHLNDAADVSGAVVVSQDPPDSRAVATGGQMTLTFNRDLPVLSPGDEMVFAAADLRSAGSSIEDNVVESIAVGRGIYLGGIERVIVQRNVIRGTSNAGIDVSEVTVPAGGGGLLQQGTCGQRQFFETRSDLRGALNIEPSEASLRSGVRLAT